MGGEGKGKKGKKGKDPYDGNKSYPPYENGKGQRKIQDVRSHRREDGGAARPPADCTIHRAYLCRLDRPRLGSTWNEQGWYSSHETSSTGQALMAFHDAYEHHEKEAIHGKLIQSNAQFVRHKSHLLATKLMAPVIHSAQSDLCDPGQRMYHIHGQLACNPAFYSGHRTHEGHHLLSVHPGRDQRPPG